jgi:drug/metabolite transporter (DMT)-like permease
MQQHQQQHADESEMEELPLVRHCDKAQDVESNKSGTTIVQPQQHVVVLGWDLSHLSAPRQFTICVIGAFGFQLAYGYLQELVTVTISGRTFAVFLAACQFLGFLGWSIVLVQRQQRYEKQRRQRNATTVDNNNQEYHPLQQQKQKQQQQQQQPDMLETGSDIASQGNSSSSSSLLQYQFAGLAMMRALDVTASNTAMQYLNYPARTILMSSRVVFTMMLGVVIQSKRYKVREYVAVSMLVLGLVLFLHAESRISAVFHPFGVLLVVRWHVVIYNSRCCDLCSTTSRDKRKSMFFTNYCCPCYSYHFISFGYYSKVSVTHI